MKIARRGRGGLVAAGLLVATAASAQAPPSTDIWLLSLDPATGDPVGRATRVTDREGYDNQPAFEASGTLLYTSYRDGQTDIFRYDPRGGATQRVTSTPESEYSPTPIPGRREMSVVRVETDGTQRLWSFGPLGTDPTVLLSEVAPVGYHAWQRDGSLVLFVLGEPATLQLVRPGAETALVIASDVGRSLQAIPGGDRFSFLQRDEEGGRHVRSLEPASGTVADLGDPLPDSQDLVWTPDGRMLMASGSSIWQRHPGDPEWTLLVDLGDDVRGITRMAVSPDGTRLALVASRESAGVGPGE